MLCGLKVLHWLRWDCDILVEPLHLSPIDFGLDACLILLFGPVFVC